jgi:predicted nucleotidyltransferase
MKIKKQITSLVNTISKKYGAKKIILFGSYAYGLHDDNSDIDLCIIADIKGKRKIDILREIRRELISQISNPIDILIYDAKEFNDRASLNNTLEHKILMDGIIVYG